MVCRYEMRARRDGVCTRLAGKVWILHLEFIVISHFSYPHINVIEWALYALIGGVRLLTGRPVVVCTNSSRCMQRKREPSRETGPAQPNYFIMTDWLVDLKVPEILNKDLN